MKWLRSAGYALVIIVGLAACAWGMLTGMWFTAMGSNW
jgi:hypothetical protein